MVSEAKLLLMPGAGASAGKSLAGVKETAAVCIELHGTEFCNSPELIF